MMVYADTPSYLKIYENGTHGDDDWKYSGNALIAYNNWHDSHWGYDYCNMYFFDIDGSIYDDLVPRLQEAVGYAINHEGWDNTTKCDYVKQFIENIVNTGVQTDIEFYKMAWYGDSGVVTGPYVEISNYGGQEDYVGTFNTSGDPEFISLVGIILKPGSGIWFDYQLARKSMSSYSFYIDSSHSWNFNDLNTFSSSTAIENYLRGNQEPQIDPPDEPSDWEDDPINPSSNYDELVSDFLTNFSVLAEIDSTNLNKIAQALNNNITVGETTQESIAKIVRALVQKNVSEGILSLKIIPIPEGGSLPYKSGIAEKLFAPIGVGDVYGKVLSNTIKKYTIGSQEIKPIYNDYRDYLVEYSIYLPFSGIHRLDAENIVGTTLYVKCDIDFLTGGIMYHIIINDNKTSRDIYTFTGDCAIELPITGTDYSAKYQSIMQGVFSGVGMLAGGALMGPGGAAGAGLLMAAGAISGLQTAGNAALVKGEYMQSGKMIPNASVLSPLYPYLIISEPQDVSPDYSSVKGRPCHKVGTLSSFSGFTIASQAKLDGIPYATDDDKEIIRAMLKSGVYL